MYVDGTLIARLLEQQAELVRQVQALRQEIRRHHRADADTAELVQATHDAMADRAFTAAELLARSLQADAAGMRLAVLLEGRSVRSVGRLLAASAGQATDTDIVLQRVGQDRTGAVWCVSATR